MRRGLVIGKFLPVHQGHIALIEYAAAHCDEVIVSMSYKPDDPIDYQLRFSWVKKIFAPNPKVKPFTICDNFDDESLALNERTRKWAEALVKIYPHIDSVISSEPYGDPLAKHLGANHLAFDPERKKIPVSATMIRNHPFQHWSFIPDVVKPFFVKKICFYGPESTGKSTMAKNLASYYHTEFVPEVARELITSNDFTVEDIIKIGQAQTFRVIEKSKTANKILFCDTDLITTQIYSQHYLQEVPPILFDLERQIKYDHYFLFDIDVIWVSDGLRDLGERRDEMYRVFKDALESRKLPYLKVSGDYEQRENFIKKEIDQILLGQQNRWSGSNHYSD